MWFAFWSHRANLKMAWLSSHSCDFELMVELLTQHTGAVWQFTDSSSETCTISVCLIYLSFFPRQEFLISFCVSLVFHVFYTNQYQV